MTAQVTEELRQAIEQTPDREPVTLIDPVNNRRYVVLREDVYQQFRKLFESEDFDIRETYAAQDALAESAWSHPEDSAYDNYDAHRKS